MLISSKKRKGLGLLGVIRRSVNWAKLKFYLPRSRSFISLVIFKVILEILLQPIQIIWPKRERNKDECFPSPSPFRSRNCSRIY